MFVGGNVGIDFAVDIDGACVGVEAGRKDYLAASSAQWT